MSFLLLFSPFPCDVAEHRMVLAVMLTGGDVMNLKKEQLFVEVVLFPYYLDVDP